MNEPIHRTNEVVSLGEGFAFFHWHIATFRNSTCRYPERDNVCADEWDRMQPEALPALKDAT